MPFAVGNKLGGRKPGRSLSEDLRLLLKRVGPDGVEYRQAFLEKTLKLAMDGHPTALKEIWERVDGKVPQPLAGELNSKVSITLQWASAPEWIKPQDVIEVQAHDTTTSD